MNPITKMTQVNSLIALSGMSDPGQFSAQILANRVLHEVANGKMTLQQTPGKTAGMRIVQSYLKAVGHNVKINGVFDPKTRLAIAEFQRKNGFRETGDLDQETLSGLSKKFLATDLGAAYVETDMTNGTTTFDPRPEDPDGAPFTIETRNDVVSSSQSGADGEFETDDVRKRVRRDDPTAYGPPGAYIDTDDLRGRDIHGGGSCRASNSQDTRQGWCPTLGCTRGQNEDVIEMADKIDEFKQRHPDVKIPYRRFRRTNPPSNQN